MAYETRRRKGVGSQTSSETSPEKPPVQRSKKSALLDEKHELLQAKLEDKKLEAKEEQEAAAQAALATSPKAGEKETREQIKDGEALMKRPTERKTDSALIKLMGPLSALQHIPPAYFEVLQALDKLLQQGVGREEFLGAARSSISDTGLLAEVMKLAGPHLKGGENTAPASAASATVPAHT